MRKVEDMKKQMSKAFGAMMVSACLFASPSYAIDLEPLFMLQLEMKDHGFDPGEPDGVMGPATRRAMAAFAEKYNLPEDPDAMLRAIVSRSSAHSFRITQEAKLSDDTLEEIKDAVASKLRDPSSVQIRNVRIVEGPEGRFYCGEVNGKNAYGGYAGFVDFNTLAGLRAFIISVEEPNSSYVFWSCALAIPKID